MLALQQPGRDIINELLLVDGDSAARAAQGKGGPDDDGKLELLAPLPHIVQGTGYAAFGHLEANLFHGDTEKLTALRLLDGRQGRANEFHPVLLQDPVLGHGHRRVQAGLAAKGRQECAGTLLFNDAGHGLGLDGFDVGPVGQVRIGHDRRRVGVDQDDLVSLFLEGLECLGAGVIELAGLSDDDGARADEHYFLQICSFGHAVVGGLYVGKSVMEHGRQYSRRARVHEAPVH